MMERPVGELNSYTIFIKILPVTILLCLAPACIESFEEVDIYNEAPDICAASADFTRAVDDCLMLREQSSAQCAGVLSFRGQLEGIETAMTDPQLARARFRYATVIDDDGTHGPLIDAIKLLGASKYAMFELSFLNIGADLSAGDAPGTYVPMTKGSTSNIFFDNGVAVTLRISNGKENREIRGLPGLGRVEFTELTNERSRGTFTLSFETAEDSITGCFEVFPNNMDTTVVDYTD